MKATVAKCVGIILSAKGRAFDENMANAWLFALHEETALEPYLLEATRECLLTEDWPTVRSVRDQAVEHLKEAKRALRASQPPSCALPAPSQESLSEHRTKMKEAWDRVKQKFTEESVIQ